MKKATWLLLAGATALALLCACGPFGQAGAPAPPESSAAISSHPQELPAVEEEEEPEEYPPPLAEGANELERLLYARNKASFETAENSIPPALTDDIAPDFADELTALDDDEIQRIITQNGDYIYETTRDEALEDIREAFRMLRYSYGAYSYYGGAEVFDAAEEEAVAALEALGSYYIWPDVLADIIIDSLLFIDDRHFSVAGEDLHPTAAMLYAEGLYLAKDENGGYFVELEGETWAVETSQNALLEQYAKPTIAPGGALALGLFHIEDGEELPVGLQLTHNGESMELPLTWVEASSGMAAGQEYSFIEAETIDGVVVCRIHGMAPNIVEDDQKAEARLVKMAEACAEETAYLVDLRGNRGGFINYTDVWFSSYGVAVPRYAETLAQKFSPLALASMEWETDEVKLVYQYAIDRGIWVTAEVDARYVADERFSFVLIDRESASAAETMAMQFGMLENSLLVGSPTMGCSLVGNCTYHFLPNSNLYLYFGCSLFLADIAEGEGAPPDIWIDPALAENAVLELITHYGLKD